MSGSLLLACAFSLLLLGSIHSLTMRDQVIQTQSDEEILMVERTQRVRVQFIGESLCPDCAAYTTDILEPIIASGLNKLIDLDYVGWGNAKNSSSGEVSCQHGPRECELNKALNCAQQLAASQEAFFKFLYCLESTAFKTSSKDVLQSCSGDASMDAHALQDCTYGFLGASCRGHAVLHVDV